MLATIALVTIAWPANLTTAAAGLSTERSQLGQACWHDPKTGWYAIKAVDCDFAHVGVTITKDRRVVEARGFDVPSFGEEQPYAIETREFSAVTKHKITMGMGLTTVTRRLGNTPKRTYDRATGFTTLPYRKTVMITREEGARLQNTYIFKKGRLIELVIQRDSIPGC